MKYNIKQNDDVIADGYMSNTPFFPQYSGPLPKTLQHLLENAQISPKHVWYIYNIHTREAYRQKGYCRKLIHKMIHTLQHQSLILLHVRYKGDTMPAFHKCYEHNDFKLYRPYNHDDIDPYDANYKIALFYRIN